MSFRSRPCIAVATLAMLGVLVLGTCSNASEARNDDHHATPSDQMKTGAPGDAKTDAGPTRASYWAKYRWPHLSGWDSTAIDIPALVASVLAVRDLVTPVPFREARPSAIAYRDANTVGDGTFGVKLIRGPPPVPIYEPVPGKRSWFGVVTGVYFTNADAKNVMALRPGIFSKVFYCRRHQHDLYMLDLKKIMNDALGWEPHSQWAKTLAVMHVLQHHEWVAWQDNDMFFGNMAFSFETFVRESQTLASPHTPNTTTVRAPDEDDEGPESLEPLRESYQVEEGPVDFILPTELEVESISTPDINTAFYVMRRSLTSVMILNESWYAPQKCFGGHNDQVGTALVFGCLLDARETDERIVPWHESEVMPTSFIRKHTRIVGPPRLVGGWATLGIQALRHRQAHHADPMVHFCSCEIYHAVYPASCGHAIAYFFTAILAVNGVPFSLGAPGTPPNGVALEDFLYYPRLAPSIVGQIAGSPFRPMLEQQETQQRRLLNVGLISVNFGRLYHDTPIPIDVVQTLRSSKVRYVRRHSALSFDDRSNNEFTPMPVPLPDEHTKKLPIRFVDSWLPFFDWILYLAPDVAIVNQDFDILSAIEKIPEHIDFIAQPVADSTDGRPFDCSMMLVRRSSFAFALLSAAEFSAASECGSAFETVLAAGEPFAPVPTNMPYLSEIRGKQRPNGTAVLADLSNVLGVPRLVYDVPELASDPGPTCATSPVPQSAFAVRVRPDSCHTSLVACARIVSTYPGLMDEHDAP